MPTSVLIKNGTIVDPKSKKTFSSDIRVEGKSIVAIKEELNPLNNENIIDAKDKLLLPGLVDIHVHIDHSPDSHHMLVRAGVTTALDVYGYPETMLSGAKEAGAGLTVGYLYPLLAGKTVPTDNPDDSEIEKAIVFALENGALGVKVLGGHYPLTPEATAKAIKIARKYKAWVTVHAGSTEAGSNIEGLEELMKLANNLPIHVAHVNSYCRGTVAHPVEEADRALKAILSSPNCCSESYLAMINGTNGLIKNGEIQSKVTRRSLVQGGYSEDRKGIENAIRNRWAYVHAPVKSGRGIRLAEPEEGLAIYNEKDTDVYLSFTVNSPDAVLSIALAKNNSGKYIVDTISTDGGAIPRNVALEKGLCMVDFGAWTLPEFTSKACYKPAMLMGLDKKGYIGEGADADLIIVDPAEKKPEVVISNGQIIFKDGNVVGSGTTFCSYKAGEEFYKKNNVEHITVAPEWLK